MDTESRVRQSFLEDAEAYYAQIESVLVGLAASELNPEALDAAMRAAHSVKGGAGMMGFMSLSHAAHRMEDFLKILRVRLDPSAIDTQVETWLLQGVDGLRAITSRLDRGLDIDDTWLTEQVYPAFEHLRDRFGDLQESEEDALLAQAENVDVSLVIFEGGVDDCLTQFEPQIDTLDSNQLRDELASTAEQLAEFGRMCELDAFVSLCVSVQQQLAEASPATVQPLARRALQEWQRCHSLVMLGRMEKIPASLDRLTPDVPSESQSAPELDAFDMAELADLETAIADLDTNAIAADLDDAISSEHADAIDMAGLEAELQSAIAALEETDVAAELDAIDLDAAMELVGDEDGRDRVAADLDAATLAELDSVALDVGALSELETAIGELDFDSLENELGESDREEIEAFAPAVPKPAPKLTVSPERQAQPSSGQTVRIPVEQLARINTLFGKLILERNAVNLRLGQMHSLVKLQKERMRRLETSNDRLRTWYDRASISGTLPGITSDAASADGLAIDEHSTQIPTPISALSAAAGDFDALEMDRYTDLHLLSQEQMETVVQLQEVSADIELSLQEMSQASRDLTFTTRGLQESITRAQMRPFADLVGRFPRIVRDLSIQHEKQVTLKIEGDLTPIDRNALEVLSDPLMHLVRNAFDHGIEEASSRISAGKSAAGTISLRAAHRGNQLVITISDDGGGINLDKIRDRCRKFGIADAQIEEMSDADLLDLIFEPGFSTADRVTELSGRGVGMDVVRTNLQDIRGTIRVDTNPGRGTTFTIALPLSLSILRVMTVAKGDMIFAVPMDSVKEVLQVPEERVVAEGDREQVSWNGTLVPLTRLESILTFTRPTKTFEMEGTPKVDRPTVLITGSSEQPRSLWLDRIWDEQEVAFRPISSPIALPPGYLGSTVLGDGRVIPLIDPALLIDELGSKGGEAAVSEVLTSDVKSDRDGHTILVVDDSINVRRFLALTLEKNGYSVEQARDGQEAVDKIVGGLDVNAVICDVEMPRLDGYGVLTEIKSDARYRDLPIAMLTSRSNDKHRKVAMNLGASAYFSKPYNERELLETLERLI